MELSEGVLPDDQEELVGRVPPSHLAGRQHGVGRALALELPAENVDLAQALTLVNEDRDALPKYFVLRT